MSDLEVQEKIIQLYRTNKKEFYIIVPNVCDKPTIITFVKAYWDYDESKEIINYLKYPPKFKLYICGLVLGCLESTSKLKQIDMCLLKQDRYDLEYIGPECIPHKIPHNLWSTTDLGIDRCYVKEDIRINVQFYNFMMGIINPLR